MSTRQRSGPRPERDGARAMNDVWLRVHLGKADAARLRELQTEEETAVDTIRRLIRTAALVKPILEALRGGRVAAAPTEDVTPREADDLVERQRATVDAWLQDD